MITAKNNITFYCLIFLLIIILSSCALNKTIVLSPIPPCNFEKNGIVVGIPEHQDNWIYVDPETNLFSFTFHVRTNILLNDISISSILLEVKSLNIEIDKTGINKTASDKYIKSTNDFYKYFNTITIDDLFSINDIVDAYNCRNRKQITTSTLYELFKKSPELTLTIEYNYTINGEIINSKILLRYITKKDTSFRFWDTWMSA